MIKRFRHKGLERVHLQDDKRGINAQFAGKLDRILLALDTADATTGLDIMNVPGWRLHPFKGELAGLWSVTVSGNWRVVFASTARTSPTLT